MSYVSLLWIVLSCGVLSGCREEEKVSRASQKKIEEPQDFHAFQTLPPEEEEDIEEKPEEEPEPLVKQEITFPDVKPLMREDHARHLRALRNQRSLEAKKLFKEPLKSQEVETRLTDPDYQQWEESKFDEDKSTYPVDRTRILTADMRIPAILEDGVNSQVGGRLIAVVDRDILNVDGTHILIPAYSRIVCHCHKLEEVGNTRLPVECSRIIRPDGVSIPLRGGSAADQAGRTGLIGEVDNRTTERYGAAFVVSALSALSQAGSTYAPNQIMGASSNSLSQNLGQVTAKVLEQNIDLTPIITIPQGARIQIIPENDIVLRAPQEKEPLKVKPHEREKGNP